MGAVVFEAAFCWILVTTTVYGRGGIVYFLEKDSPADAEVQSQRMCRA